MLKPIQIAIDGHSSTGKSTLAKKIARYFNILYIDSGAMYRAVTFFALQNNCIINHQLDKIKLIYLLNKIEISFLITDATQPQIQLNGQVVEQNIRTLEVANWVSQVAEIDEVRQKLVNIQREISNNQSVVMDGRDIGTVVFPKAMIKIFMTASPDIRAKRRFEELTTKGLTVSYDEVYQNVIQRDEIDSNRKNSPLTQAKDAILIDNSFLSQKTQTEIVLKIIKKKTGWVRNY